VVLYSFKGEAPSGLTADRDGNLYGTTTLGGSGPCSKGCGTVFELAPDGKETSLYDFQGGVDGSAPLGVIRDKDGNLYGTTASGGSAKCEKKRGCGTVFALTPDGTETVLYAFQGGNDGALPSGGLLRDKVGGLYGTTGAGGAADKGTIFKLAPDGTETVLYSFCAQFNCEDGDGPSAGMIEDEAGNFYGTTGAGGAADKGTVFKLAPDGTETVLYSFCAQFNCEDGESPNGGVVMDDQGDLYGTTLYGGIGENDNGGVVFKLTPDGSETVVHSFSLLVDGSTPYAGVILDRAGNLYGTLAAAPDNIKNPGPVFCLRPDGRERLYHVPSNLYTGVIDRNGALYGTGWGGDARYPGGIAYEIQK
jgi:uncharacterized repeat protein (TIGR03803 family)